MTYDPANVEASLEALLAKLAKDDDAKLTALPSADLQSLQTHRAAIEECITVGIIFLKGFDGIMVNGPLRKLASAPVQNWVDRVPRGQSATRIAGMIASSICSVLEGFIVDVVPPKITDAQIATARKVEPHLDADDEMARVVLAGRLKPSTRGGGEKWLRRLDRMLSVVPTAAEADTLLHMVAFRNQYIHDPPTAFSQMITGEHLKCWPLAAITLCHRIVTT